jgi:hypothetical protein
MATLSHIFTIDEPIVALNEGEKLIFRLKVDYKSSNVDSIYTSNLGELEVGSLAPQTGYASTSCPYINTGSNSHELVFSQGITSYYDDDYLFVPNPLTGSQNSLYPTYGDVDYVFLSKPGDIVLIYLSDGTYLETRIRSIYYNSSSLLVFDLDPPLSSFAQSNIINNTFKRFLLLTRIDDETNINLTFTKRPGQTSYGFLIPDDLASDVLAKIDTITKQVKQKLLADQQGTTSQ